MMTLAGEASAPPRQKPLTLFISHRSALIDYASRIVGDPASAEDVVQEAWLRFASAAGLRFLEQPLAYLYRVVRNLALDERRRRQRENSVLTGHGLEQAAELSPDGQPTPEAAALYRDEYQVILEALAELPERTRTALEMHRLGGAKLREIAAVLGISVALAHILVADGVRHCKQRLGWP